MNIETTELVKIMARLRAPDGCPWDRQQTHETLKPYLVEESYEALDAIDRQNASELKEELGDVLLQVIFHAQIAQEHGKFTFADVVSHLSHKLIRRHPHVFNRKAHTDIQSAKDVALNWESIKAQERHTSSTPPSALAGIPKSAPALQRAFQVQKRAAKSGFDWKSVDPVLEKVREECDELYIAMSNLIEQRRMESSPALEQPKHTQVEAEFGDVLFSLVNLARFLKINPEESLRQTTNRFITRFQHIEAKVLETRRVMSQCTEEELDQFWEEAKDFEKRNVPGSNESDSSS